MKMDERAIVLTDQYLYRLDSKRNFHLTKSGIALEEITALSVTSGKEQLIVVHLTSNHDFVFYMQTNVDHVPEFVAHIAKLKQDSYVTCSEAILFVRIDFRSTFSVNVQRYVPAYILKHKYVINVIWERTDKIEFRKGSNNNISLMIPDHK